MTWGNEAAVRTASVDPVHGLGMSRTDKLVSYLLPSSVALMTLIVFSRALQNGFVNWDDSGDSR